jgi:hypothetical protein
MIVTIRVLAMSDLHVEFEPFTFSLEETPDPLVLAGDIGPGPRAIHLECGVERPRRLSDAYDEAPRGVASTPGAYCERRRNGPL